MTDFTPIEQPSHCRYCGSHFVKFVTRSPFSQYSASWECDSCKHWLGGATSNKGRRLDSVFIAPDFDTDYHYSVYLYENLVEVTAYKAGTIKRITETIHFDAYPDLKDMLLVRTSPTSGFLSKHNLNHLINGLEWALEEKGGAACSG